MNDVQELEHLNELDRIVKDKRNTKRADAKKERRNRHYVKVLIKHQLKRLTDPRLSRKDECSTDFSL